MTALQARVFSARLITVLLLAASVGQTATARSLTLSSAAFRSHGTIPAQYTCDGRGDSPQLHWSGLPEGTRSVALIVEDPDAPDPAAPTHTWVHWVLYDIPITARDLPEGVATQALPAGTRAGLNSWHRTGYGAPCPPVGRHRYFFHLFALDTILSDLHRPTEQKLRHAMTGHVLARTRLIGTYQRP